MPTCLAAVGRSPVGSAAGTIIVGGYQMMALARHGGVSLKRPCHRPINQLLNMSHHENIVSGSKAS